MEAGDTPHHSEEVLARWATNFVINRTRIQGGPTAWHALNAATEWYNRRRQVRAPGEAARHDSRVYSRVWGNATAAKAKAMQMELSR